MKKKSKKIVQTETRRQRRERVRDEVNKAICYKKSRDIKVGFADLITAVENTQSPVMVTIVADEFDQEILTELARYSRVFIKSTDEGSIITNLMKRK